MVVLHIALRIARTVPLLRAQANLARGLGARARCSSGVFVERDSGVQLVDGEAQAGILEDDLFAGPVLALRPPAPLPLDHGHLKTPVGNEVRQTTTGDTE